MRTLALLALTAVVVNASTEDLPVDGTLDGNTAVGEVAGDDSVAPIMEDMREVTPEEELELLLQDEAAEKAMEYHDVDLEAAAVHRRERIAALQQHVEARRVAAAQPSEAERKAALRHSRSFHGGFVHRHPLEKIPSRRFSLQLSEEEHAHHARHVRQQRRDALAEHHGHEQAHELEKAEHEHKTAIDAELTKHAEDVAAGRAAPLPSDHTEQEATSDPWFAAILKRSPDHLSLQEVEDMTPKEASTYMDKHHSYFATTPKLDNRLRRLHTLEHAWRVHEYREAVLHGPDLTDAELEPYTHDVELERKMHAATSDEETAELEAEKKARIDAERKRRQDAPIPDPVVIPARMTVSRRPKHDALGYRDYGPNGEPLHDAPASRVHTTSSQPVEMRKGDPVRVNAAGDPEDDEDDGKEEAMAMLREKLGLPPGAELNAEDVKELGGAVTIEEEDDDEAEYRMPITMEERLERRARHKKMTEKERTEAFHKQDPSRCYEAASRFCPGLAHSHAGFLRCAIERTERYHAHDAFCPKVFKTMFGACVGDLERLCGNMDSDKMMRCLAAAFEKDVAALKAGTADADLELSETCRADPDVEDLFDSLEADDGKLTDEEKDIIHKWQEHHISRQKKAPAPATTPGAKKTKASGSKPKTPSAAGTMRTVPGSAVPPGEQFVANGRAPGAAADIEEDVFARKSKEVHAKIPYSIPHKELDDF